MNNNFHTSYTDPIHHTLQTIDQLTPSLQPIKFPQNMVKNSKIPIEICGKMF